jgi:hypothetical protein
MIGTRVPLGLAFAAVVAVVLGTSVVSAQQPATPVSHSAELRSPRVDVLEDGKVVISIDSTGDLQGLVTLTLQKTETGLYSGEWALMVSRVDNTDPATGIEPPAGHEHRGEVLPHPDQPHKDFARLEQRGALAGSVKDAMIVLDADGKLGDINAPLTIAQGTLEFRGAAGSGRITLAGLSLVF